MSIGVLVVKGCVASRKTSAGKGRRKQQARGAASLPWPSREARGTGLTTSRRQQCSSKSQRTAALT
eukprot:scaffold230482_cov28-Prasinocladus_malaysianus.AAC.1